MRLPLLLILTLTVPVAAQTMPREVIEQQNTTFERLWGEKFEWKFDDLPTKGKVQKYRIPYSGYIYPDREGGTERVMKMYDRAFNRGRPLAEDWEKHDTTAYKERKKGLLGVLGVQETPYWYGHCNGWAAAAIRHAEPQKSVTRNGVEFTPADIKALLAELYIYNDTEILAGLEYKLNPGALHAILANWLGRGAHPIAMEADPTKEKWNYPIYAFSTSSTKISSRQVEVRTNVLYATDTDDGEYHESPRLHDIKEFHYTLELDSRGRITGGQFMKNSDKIDFIWIPLRPKQGGRPGNESGNPHIDVDTVLSIWRASAPKALQEKWLTVDPTDRADAGSIARSRPRTSTSPGRSANEDDARPPRVARVPRRDVVPSMPENDGAAADADKAPSSAAISLSLSDLAIELEPIPDPAFASADN